MTDEELKLEVGYEIEEIEDKGNEFTVKVRHPDAEGTLEKFHFDKNERWLSTREYVVEGEKREDPEWKIRVEKVLRERIQNSQREINIESSDLKDYEGETLDL